MLRIIFILSLALLVRLFLFYTSNSALPIHTTSFNQELKLPIITSAKEKTSESFKKTLPADSADLLLGILFGEKGSFDKEYLDALRRTGVLHVIAASGMNVSMVAGVALPVLVLLLKRSQALIVSAILIIIYCAFADFEESIVRASIMAAFAFGAGLFGRQNTSLLALFFAVFTMVMWDPKIVESVGFQLSFAATSGIILLAPIFRKFGNNFLLEDLSTTMSAQIATVPILLFYFSTYSPISILANLLILWTVPPLMILGLIALPLSLIAEVFAVPILWIAFPLLVYFKEVILFLNKFATEFSTDSIPITMILGYYFIVLAGIAAAHKKLKIRI